jgi:hypothetical protein
MLSETFHFLMGQLFEFFLKSSLLISLPWYFISSGNNQATPPFYQTTAWQGAFQLPPCPSTLERI